MFSVDRRTRILAAGAALIAFAGAFRFAATAGEVDGPLAPVAPSTPAAAVPPPRVSVVMPRRDPFAAPAVTAVSAPANVSAAALPAFPAALTALPPNAGAGPLPFSLPSAQHVSAIVTGPRPVALIDDGTTTRVIVRGDRVDGARVVRIDAAGVHLDDGTTLAAAPASQHPSTRRTR